MINTTARPVRAVWPFAHHGSNTMIFAVLKA